MAITTGQFTLRYALDFTPLSFLYQEAYGRLNDKLQTRLAQPGLGQTSKIELDKRMWNEEKIY